ncbi:MAG: hypothetical protein KDH99_09935 [Alcanivoracaceae bacterium]|nr:hypothetical protein [Alcanivoracaceae bacterium]
MLLTRWYECSVETCYLTLEFSKRKGTPTIEYFGIDTAGNVSATVTEPMRP